MGKSLERKRINTLFHSSFGLKNKFEVCKCICSSQWSKKYRKSLQRIRWLHQSANHCRVLPIHSIGTCIPHCRNNICLFMYQNIPKPYIHNCKIQRSSRNPHHRFRASIGSHNFRCSSKSCLGSLLDSRRKRKHRHSRFHQRGNHLWEVCKCIRKWKCQDNNFNYQLLGKHCRWRLGHTHTSKKRYSKIILKRRWWGLSTDTRKFSNQSNN